MTYNEINDSLKEAQELLKGIPNLASISMENRLQNVQKALHRAISTSEGLVEDHKSAVLRSYQDLSQEAKDRAIHHERWSRRNDEDAPRDDVVGKVLIEQDLIALRRVFREDGSRTDGIRQS